MNIPPGYNWLALQPNGSILLFRERPVVISEDAFGSVDYPCWMKTADCLCFVSRRPVKKPYRLILKKLY